MRQSQLFTKTRREAPKDEESKNAQLLIRAGFINKEMAGVYDYLPLGQRVLKKIEGIIREEMNDLGAQEVSLASLQDKGVWEETGRWSDEVVDNWFKTELKSGTQVGLASTHEEPLTKILSEYVSSYRDLPLSVYQFQTKFRNELRAKSGIMRVREFMMKDLYTFARTEAEHGDLYEKFASAYRKIFDRVGIGEITYRTKASGGSFTTDFTDEFQALSNAGEDIIYITDEANKRAVNKEVEEVGGEAKKAIEVGNIFPLGTKFSEALGLKYTDESGAKQPVIMGSYGIGLGRLMGTVVEVLSDDKGIVWPASIAPFQVHLLALTEGARNLADETYELLTSQGVEVLYDDRDLRAGEKFNDADLIGIPLQVIVGDKSSANKLEVKTRATGAMRELSIEEIIEECTK